jgi:anaerobic selenocysteine-containing dehydrogenase
MGEQVIRTLCQLCHTNCGLCVRRTADGALSITGDPDHPMNRGYHCPKALANAAMVNAADRLRHPLVKTKSGLKTITWDDALDMAAGRLAELRDIHGPFCLARFGGAPVSYQGRDGFLEFMGAFGSPNLTGVGNLCMAPRMTAFKAVTGAPRAEPDYDNSRLVIFWGSNPLGVQRFSSYAAYDGYHRIILRLKKKGIRIVCIDPFATPTAKIADDWLRIRPGTDAALGLAMIHVIIAEGLFNRAFVQCHTDGFPVLARHVRECGPCWAEKLTGIPADTIGALARDYATAGSAAIHEGNGLDMYANGVDMVRTIAILICLTGNLDVAGGNVLMPFPPSSPLPTRPIPTDKRVWHSRFPLFPQVPFTAIKEALLREEDDRPRAMIVHHANPVLTQANERRTRKALGKLDFLVVCDIFPTATTAMADLVLPVACGFESYGYRAYTSSAGGFLAFSRPVAPPIGGARSVFEVEYDLATRMRMHHHYPFRDDRSWIEYMLRPTGITFERLEREQIVFVGEKVRYRKYLENGFSTPSGKVQFCVPGFEKWGATPLPEHRHPAGEPFSGADLKAKGCSLIGTSRRPAQFVHTKFRNLADIARSYPEPLIHMHPDDGAVRHIQSGDEVEVVSPVGRIRLKAKLTTDTFPGRVAIDFGWGNPSDGKANINRLVSDEYFDPISGGTPNRLFPCEVKAVKRSKEDGNA